MTKQEFSDLYDSLYYGHEAELEISGLRYFIEWNNAGIDVYLLKGGSGMKVASFYQNNKYDILDELFAYEIDGIISLNTSYNQVTVVDIE